jgi:hypothetical protein
MKHMHRLFIIKKNICVLKYGNFGIISCTVKKGLKSHYLISADNVKWKFLYSDIW